MGKGYKFYYSHVITLVYEEDLQVIQVNYRSRSVIRGLEHEWVEESCEI